MHRSGPRQAPPACSTGLATGNSIDNAGFRLTFTGGGSLTANSPITGTGAFVHNGSGTVVLAAANTYSGSTAITCSDGVFIGGRSRPSRHSPRAPLNGVT
ncbi:MAG: hypothetical protein ACKO9B_02450 [Planctomycetota bacterium]